MVVLNHVNTGGQVPKKGDILVIETKKSKGQKLMCKVKEVVNGEEVILQKSTNSFFIWSLYELGESWVWRVWNLGPDITLTTSVNNLNQLQEF